MTRGKSVMHCTDCSRDFSGTRTYELHLERRKDRCRSDAKLRRLGLVRRQDGVWSQKTPYRQGELPLEGIGARALVVLAVVLAVGTALPSVLAAGHHPTRIRGQAVWYSDTVGGACGVPLRGFYAAHRTLPCGSRVLLHHYGRSVTVTVRDRGPFGQAVIDLAPRAFRRLAPLGAGRIHVHGVVLRRGW